MKEKKIVCPLCKMYLYEEEWGAYDWVKKMEDIKRFKKTSGKEIANKEKNHENRN